MPQPLTVTDTLRDVQLAISGRQAEARAEVYAVHQYLTGLWAGGNLTPSHSLPQLETAEARLKVLTHVLDFGTTYEMLQELHRVAMHKRHDPVGSTAAAWEEVWATLGELGVE
ncbi:hypothetical protein [Leifsonia sp. Leaf264]|uniref:hypothetical protein n=1 Tax=Leifsonia sp. Leaf264 TaxID=1736314 RepID=UPI0006F7AD20|nr:hypothetical protein [Leifsonia sp. Leaf264]KQO98565.1 hypothetical protein ASF30_10915 [Leifsonia sp. Leaf264]